MSDIYSSIYSEFAALLSEPIPPISAMSNLSSLLWMSLEKINWAGFYVTKADTKTLYLGPFQGKPACQVIQFGRGVCGTAAQCKTVEIVPDVHTFPGHIACDSASQSEIVLPVLIGNDVRAVLDLDSPVKGRFTQSDADALSRLVQLLVERVDWAHGLL